MKTDSRTQLPSAIRSTVESLKLDGSPPPQTSVQTSSNSPEAIASGIVMRILGGLHEKGVVLCGEGDISLLLGEIQRVQEEFFKIYDSNSSFFQGIDRVIRGEPVGDDIYKPEYLINTIADGTLPLIRKAKREQELGLKP